MPIDETSAQERVDHRYALMINELRALPSEATWVEFKDSNRDPDRIAKTVSGLSNSARLADKAFGYLVWGIEDGTHRVVGTDFEPAMIKRGNERLEFWLSKVLDPSPAIVFRAVPHPAGRIVLLEVPAASLAPVQFNGCAYIRIGDATPPLHEHQDRLRALWTKLQPLLWEEGVCAGFQTSDDVLSSLDYPSYFKLTEQRLPDNRDGILKSLSKDRIIAPDVGGHWDITNLGAILFANDLSTFDRIQRKVVRVIQYSGSSRADSAREQTIKKGYAAGFDSIIATVSGLLPRNEHIGKAFRADRPMYPEIAVREIVANTLIHQDMTVRGAGPVIELYSDRIEITNPGLPLVEVERFIGAPPRSRNETMASLMRRMRICEERGQGIVKVVTAAEIYQLPPPDFRTLEHSFQVALLAPREFRDMTAAERLRACSQHACLRYLSGSRMTNSTLRERFGISGQNAAMVSRIIADALKFRMIRAADASAPRSGYIPAWA